MPRSVRISAHGREMLAQLAREGQMTMTEVLEVALESYRRHRFLEQASAAYASLAADPAAERDYRQEMTLLDATIADGLEH